MQNFRNDTTLDSEMSATIGFKPDVQVAHDFMRPEVRLTLGGKFNIITPRSARQIAAALIRAAEKAERNQS